MVSELSDVFGPLLCKQGSCTPGMPLKALPIFPNWPRKYAARGTISSFRSFKEGVDRDDAEPVVEVAPEEPSLDQKA